MKNRSEESGFQYKKIEISTELKKHKRDFKQLTVIIKHCARKLNKII